MRHKLIATVLGVGLIGLAAVGAFASQDGVQTNVETPTATSKPRRRTRPRQQTLPSARRPRPRHQRKHRRTIKAEGTEGPESERTIKGIPTDNPNHHPDNGDGVCEKGETAIKTTPSGVKVNVPCQAAGHTNNGDHGTPEADNTETPDD